MNNLIAVTAQDSFHTYEVSGLWGNIKGVGPVVNSAISFANGDPLGGFVNLATAGIDLVGALVDPIATLGASIAGLLLDYLPPLPMLLDALAGNPAIVQGIGETWKNIETELTAIAADVEAGAQQVLSGWQGPAADAFRQFASNLGELLQQVATIAGGLGVGFAVASVVVEVVRAIVKDMICDLVGKLISFVTQAIATFGIGISWCVPQAVIKIAEWAEKIRGWTDALLDKFTLLKTLVTAIDRGLNESLPAIERMYYYLRNAEIFRIGVTIPNIIAGGSAGYDRGQEAFG